MPPDVGKAGGAGTPVISQAPIKIEEPKTKEIDNKDQKQEPPKQDVETAAKNAEAAKQQARGKKSDNVTREQLVKKELNANWEAEGARFAADAANAGVGTLRDATASAAKTSKTEKATSPDKPAQQKKTDKPSEGTVWESVKGAARFAADAANAGVVTLRETTANASAVVKDHEIRRQRVEKLTQRQYPQDMVPGEFHEVEKITPGSTDKTKTIERVEDRSVGDVASRRYHQEQQRTSTQSGLEDRLNQLNQGKELTTFEKGLVSEWNPQMKGGKKDSITALSPIMGLDSTGAKGPTEVQAYKIQRGNVTTYYDRNGNVVEPKNRQQKVVELDQRKHPQDMVRGGFYQVEQITPGSTNKTKTREYADDLGLKDISSRNFHPSQSRTSTQSGLEDRLKELNQGKELTPFEEGLVSEWDPQMKRVGEKDPITNLSPIMGVDSSGKKVPGEVQAYKVDRGIDVTYYDRSGNVLKNRSARGAGQAIPTDGPGDYFTAAGVVGKKVGKLAAREAGSVAKAEAGAVAKAETGAVAKAETGAAVRTAEQQVAKAETNAAAKEASSPGPGPTPSKADKSSGVKDSHLHEKNPPESKKPGDAKGANVSKTNRMSRPQAEIDKEIADVNRELREVEGVAGELVKENRRSMGQTLPGDMDTNVVKAELARLANTGNKRAESLLQEIRDLESRRTNLAREKLGFPDEGDPNRGRPI